MERALSGVGGGVGWVSDTRSNMGIELSGICAGWFKDIRGNR